MSEIKFGEHPFDGGLMAAFQKDEAEFIEMLRQQGKLIEADQEDVPLPPGVTHVLVRATETEPEKLVRRRFV